MNSSPDASPWQDVPKTPEEVTAAEKMCREIYKYFQTNEGFEHGKQIAALVDSWDEQPPVPDEELSDQEKAAFAFIKERLLQKQSPSVREVAGAAGVSSSRSGAKIINFLIAKGYVERDVKGSLKMSDKGWSRLA